MEKRASHCMDKWCHCLAYFSIHHLVVQASCTLITCKSASFRKFAFIFHHDAKAAPFGYHFRR